MTFTIVLKVPSKVDAKQVDVCDTLPAALVFESAPGATFSKGRACWHLALAKAGSTTSVQDHGQGRHDAKAGVVKNVVVATAGNAGKVTARAPVKVAPAWGGAGGRVSRRHRGVERAAAGRAGRYRIRAHVCRSARA